MTEPARDVGPWHACIDLVHDAAKRPWIIRRSNPAWFGGIEILTSATGHTKRYATERAALKAIEAKAGELK